MATSPAEAASAAVDRLRAAREHAHRRRDAARRAVEQLRERNREESRRLAERTGPVGPGQPPLWPSADEPRELRLYDADDLELPHAPPRPQPPDPGTAAADWPQESWLH